MREDWLVYNCSSSTPLHHSTHMDPPKFVNHYRTLIRGLRISGLPTPWIRKPSVLLRLPYLFYDLLMISIVLYMLWCYLYTIQGKLAFDELCALGVGISLFTCGLLVTYYHSLYGRRLQRITENTDRLAAALLRSGLDSSHCLQQLYRKNSSAIAVLTNNTIVFSFFCPVLYCLSVPVVDSIAGRYRCRQPLPITSPFDDKRAGLYELIALVLAISNAISCAKKGVNDCLFLALFRIQSSFLQFLSTSLENLQKEFLVGGDDWNRKILIRWVALHQEVLRNIQELVMIFSPVVIIYYLNVIGIVVCGLFTQTMNDNGNVMQSIGVGSYVLVTVLHMLLLSNTAEDLKTKAQRIAFVAYDVPWFEMNKTNADMLRMVVKTSNKEIHVTAYRAPIFLLSRETFAGFSINCIKAFVTLVQMKRRFE
ncbi:unnamed protein product [Nezara viridula]|uniref:Odorant receptor n=1 Tax=Nezara viridula TaxID=85310 RepID=A0A9P0HN11_NEZVI|nr:unnamed protein product [Nezara viridula]